MKLEEKISAKKLEADVYGSKLILMRVGLAIGQLFLLYWTFKVTGNLWYSFTDPC